MMNKTNDIVAHTEDTSKLVRARFCAGMLLQHEDLEALNAYTRDLSRLMFRSLFGCGVVCGLVVKPKPPECKKVPVTVGAGLAIDCSGDPVYVPQEQCLAFDESESIDGPLWVVLCGTTKNCAPRTALCASDDDEATPVCTRERDKFEIAVVTGKKPPNCACGCPSPPDGAPLVETDCKCVKPYQPAEVGKNCYDSHYDGTCGGACDEGADCGCKCILLARLDKTAAGWTANHQVRRFIRPVLMRDPQVESEKSSTDGQGQPDSSAQTVMAALKDWKAASQSAVLAAEAVGNEANMVSAATADQTNKLAAAQVAAKQLTKAKAAAEKLLAAAGTATEGKAVEAAKQAAADADKADELAKQTATEAETAKADVEAAKAKARKAMEIKEDADRVSAATAEKLAALVKE
jgi:hypothetical protein